MALMSPTHVGPLKEIIEQQRAEIERLKERIRVGFPRPLEPGEFDIHYVRIQAETTSEMRAEIEQLRAAAKAKREKIAALPYTCKLLFADEPPPTRRVDLDEVLAILDEEAP